MLTPNEYACGDYTYLLENLTRHSGITRSMIRLRRKKKRHAQQDRREFQSPTLAKLGGWSSAISPVCMLQTTVAEYDVRQDETLLLEMFPSPQSGGQQPRLRSTPSWRRTTRSPRQTERLHSGDSQAGLGLLAPGKMCVYLVGIKQENALLLVAMHSAPASSAILS
ncbi:hypothetical protein PI126_g22886 [Phytophthora idaei]|nr:hypothetical protein PI126_g22886 [Phytophthora idaei]